MELITMICFSGLMGWGFSKTLSSKSDYKSNITKIDDKNWIVNNRFISFEKDTPILRMEQKMEDDKHYNAFEWDKMTNDRKIIRAEWMKTISVMSERKDITPPTEKELIDIESEYNEYSTMCDKLTEHKLTKEEFMFQQNNFSDCITFDRMMLIIPTGSGTYYLHNESTARYHKGNMEDLMAEEFKKKHY
tara:strand:+ start:6980 stop:7549 length:570 start_codon:yes stop_codon:yes gene_type:complete